MLTYFISLPYNKRKIRY